MLQKKVRTCKTPMRSCLKNKRTKHGLGLETLYGRGSVIERQRGFGPILFKFQPKYLADEEKQ